MVDVDKEIKDVFMQEKTIIGTVRRTGYSWNKIVKSLSSNGIIINKTHRKILEMYYSGIEVQDIARELHISIECVQSYLPRVRPVYGLTLSANAKRIKKCRAKKRNIQES